MNKLKGHKNSLIIALACFAIIIVCLIYACPTVNQGNCVDQALATAAVAERHNPDAEIKAVVGKAKGGQHVEIMGDGKTYTWDSYYWELKESQGVSSHFKGPVKEYPIDVFRKAAMNHDPLYWNQLDIYQAVEEAVQEPLNK